MDNYKFINKKHIKTKDKEFFNCNLYNVSLDSIVTIFISSEVYNKISYKFGDMVKSSDITSSSYVNKYGQTVTSISLI